jgi:exodeoxyribonuclease VII large subunit
MSLPPTPQSPALAAERDIYSISRLNREAKTLLEGHFPLLWIEGEISNLARPASGHLYFSLKDSQAQIRCALFKGSQRGLGCVPKDGMQVLVRARVSLYEGRGEFQLIVETLEEAGEGALRRAFELLKNRLAAEGLFDPAHKKPLPVLPKRIGIITSPTGAALRDVLTTLRRRFPAIAVLVYPVPVQGEGAADKIAAAIRLAGQRRDCDALILARGGGSLEDLWSFNEEVVARAVYACPLPLVCGVGHETDFSIADWVADARAPTPTAAAEMLSPNQDEWLAQFVYLETRVLRLMRDQVSAHQQRLDWLSGRIVHPRERIARLQQRLADLNKRMRLAQLAGQRVAGARWQALTARLYRRHPEIALREWRLRVQHMRALLVSGMRQCLQAQQQRMQLAVHRLDTLSPLATLQRGYAIVRRADNNLIVRNARDIAPGERLQARLAQGSLLCVVDKIEADD